jgi:hypothetical protein
MSWRFVEALRSLPIMWRMWTNGDEQYDWLAGV